MESVLNAVTAVNDKLWLVVIVILVGSGIWFCATTRLVQIRYIPDMFKAIVEKPSDISEGQKVFQPSRHSPSRPLHVWAPATWPVWLSRWPWVGRVRCSGCG